MEKIAINVSNLAQSQILCYIHQQPMVLDQGTNYEENPSSHRRRMREGGQTDEAFLYSSKSAIFTDVGNVHCPFWAECKLEMETFSTQCTPCHIAQSGCCCTPTSESLTISVLLTSKVIQATTIH